MKTKKNILFLLENGLSSNTISSLSNKQFGLLVEKFKKLNKKETNEVMQVSKTDTNTINQLKSQKKPFEVYEKEIQEDETDDVTSSNALGKDAEQDYTGQRAPHMANDMAPDGMDDDSDDDRSMMGVSESEINEKFESKAQQGLFWARCNKCSSKNCKWCKMAKEFSDSTTKKEYKNMPEKKHPEKTVTYKKSETKESLQKFLESVVSKVVEESIKTKMTKSDLLETLKKKIKNNNSMIIRKPKKMTMFSNEAPMKLPIGNLYSIGKKTKK